MFILGVYFCLIVFVLCVNSDVTTVPVPRGLESPDMNVILFRRFGKVVYSQLPQFSQVRTSARL